MTSRFVTRLGVAALAAAMAWVALWSWEGLVETPGRFLSPALLGGLLLIVVGAGGRTLRWPWYAVLPAQVVVLFVWLDHRYAAAEAWGGWIPTTASVRQLAERIQDGATAVNTYTSPVSAEHSEIYAYMLATSLVVMLSTDLLACGLRRVPWAGLPVIVTLTVPISVLESGLSWVVFVATSLLFIMLLATEETERVLGWGRSIAGRGERIDSLDQVVNGSTVRGSALRLGLLTAAGALVIPIAVPVSDGLFNGGDGPGDGPGRGDSVTLDNPILNLRADLISRRHIPLVEARTEADPSYLRLTVLDRFNGVEWEPSTRRLSGSNNADGDLPSPPGLAPTTTGTEEDWALRITERFQTSWLPTPYPTRRIDVNEGDWRYDLRTLDIAGRDQPDTHGLRYELTGFTPQLSPTRMQQALKPPSEILEPMTSVPGNRPSVVTRIAQEVTAAGDTDYDRMVLLQTWFRNSGGFRYSLEPDAGASIDRLAEFLTTDKVGYCEQFAAAMAIMARTLGVPSRVVVGFLKPEELDDGSYLYTSDELHAWPEMYFGGSGWVRFEPTPAARSGVPPTWTLGAGPIPTSAPSVTTSPGAQDTPTPDSTPTTPTDDQSSDAGSNLVGWGAGVVLLVVALWLPHLVRTRQRRRRLDIHRLGPRVDDAHVLANGAWEELCATARDLGIRLPQQRSVREVAGVLRRRADPGGDAVRRLDVLVEFIERARYGRPFTVDAAVRQSVVEAVERWTVVLADSVPARRARFARVFPLSLLDRGDAAILVDRQVEMVG